jgi:hypothetical protein
MPVNPELRAPTRAAIRETCRRMVAVPVPLLGTRGIGYLAKRLERWPQKLGDKQARANVANVIRMQEEIGTGGAGFRFLYAAFLQEAADLLGRPTLAEFSQQLTGIGDRWREFAVLGAKVCKNRENKPDVYHDLAELLRDCAVREQRLFSELRTAV